MASTAAAAPGRQTVSQSESVARIDITGPLVKRESWWTRWAGMAIATDIADAVKSAAADPAVRAIILVIDSPGGEVGGIDALARAVADASRIKPTVAFGDDLLASAAYWIASQTRRIYANPAAQVGSIGTYAVVADWSRFFQTAGVKVHVIRAGQFKGAGVTGTPIEEAQLAEFQRTVNSVNEEFLRGVAQGRRLPMARVKELADGRIHIAAGALRLGLIDEVASLDTVIARLKAGTAGQWGASMGIAPSVMELQTAIPTADSSFVIEARRRGWTVENATAEFARREAARPASVAELQSALPAGIPAEFVSQCMADAMTTAQAVAAWAKREEAELASDRARREHDAERYWRRAHGLR
ncbi:MAG: S49 family peptidase [Planctomycetota bacterium]